MSAASCDVYFLTGEPSGDAYAAAIAQDLQAIDPEIRCRGIGGGAMAAAGLALDERMDDYAVMGLFPVLRRLPEFMALGKRVESAVRDSRPQIVLSIDYPGFNIRLQRRLADLKASRIHVVAPQVWAWRPRRAKKYAQSVDQLMCFFPFEPPLFSRFGCEALFVGHPMVDMVLQDGHLTEERENLLMLAPGGRRREVESLLPDFDLAARILRRRMAESGQEVPAVVIAAAENVDDAVYQRLSGFPRFRGDYRGLCRRARAGIIASGTATLEAALVALPHVIAYRMDAVSARIARHLVLTPWVGLPNIVHNHSVVPELLQEACSGSRIAATLEGMWAKGAHERMTATLSQTAGLLGGGGAMRRIATHLAHALGG